MGDWNTATGPVTRRRRATITAGRGVSLQPVNGRSTAASLSSLAADISIDDGHRKIDCSLETIRPKTKSEKRKRRDDFSDRMR